MLPPLRAGPAASSESSEESLKAQKRACFRAPVRGCRCTNGNGAAAHHAHTTHPGRAHLQLPRRDRHACDTCTPRAPGSRAAATTHAMHAYQAHLEVQRRDHRCREQDDDVAVRRLEKVEVPRGGQKVPVVSDHLAQAAEQQPHLGRRAVVKRDGLCILAHAHQAVAQICLRRLLGKVEAHQLLQGRYCC